MGRGWGPRPSTAARTTCGCTSPGCRLRHRRRPMIVRGEGAYVWDAQNLARPSTPSANLRQPARTAAPTSPRPPRSRPPSSPSSPVVYAHPPPSARREKIAGYAPGDLNRVFFTSGGGGAVESAWEARQNYFKLTGKPLKHRSSAAPSPPRHHPRRPLDHPACCRLKQQFRPLVPLHLPGAEHQHHRAPVHGTTGAFGAGLPTRIASRSRRPRHRRPSSSAVQNAGGCFPPPPGY